MDEPLTSIPGVTLRETRQLWLELAVREYVVDSEFDAKDVPQLLRAVTESDELTFFDSKHPQLSDPGAFIALIREGTPLLIKHGNHGWSSAWIRTTEADASRYLALCLSDLSTPESRRFSVIGPIRPEHRGRRAWWPWPALRRHLKRRLAGQK